MKKRILTAVLAITAAAGLAGCTLNPVTVTRRILKDVEERRAATADEAEAEAETQTSSGKTNAEKTTEAAERERTESTAATAAEEKKTETERTAEETTAEETTAEKTTAAGTEDVRSESVPEEPEAVLRAYVYMSDAGTTLVLQEDNTCIYTEVESTREELTCMYFGTWTIDESTNTLDVMVTTIHDYELTADMENRKSFLLQCANGQPWSDEILNLTDMSEGSFLGSYAKDGFYTGCCTGEGCGSGQFESAEIVGGYLQVIGCLNYYTDQNRSSSGMQEYGYSEIWFPVADNLEIYASGGDAADERIEASDLNRVFGPGMAIGLDMEVFLENGEVVKILICS